MMTYLLLVNAFGLWIMCNDKQRAKKNLWRIPERTLLTVAILGGSVGVYAGMRIFHHKTRKPKFSIGVPAIILLQLTAIAYL